MSMTAKWTFVESSSYGRCRRSYSRDHNVLKALDELLNTLQVAPDPRRLGDRKFGRLEGVYGAKLSKSVRLLYVVDYDARQIKLLAIGNHKETYGRD